jgi:hypothetical protein
MSATGISFTSVDSAGHVASPKSGTYTRENGDRASLLNKADYPITAECKICGGRIRLDALMQMEWRHVPAEVVAPSSPAGDTA